MNGLPMDENLHGLLAELVRGGEPTSLGRARWFNDLLRPDLQLLAATTSESALEAKLVTAYREELAHVLLLAGRARFEASGHPFVTPRDEQGAPRPLDIRDIQARASALHESPRAQRSERGPLALLEEVVRGPEGGPAAPSQFAIAALRLVPSAATRIWLGTFCEFEGKQERCLELQHSALATKPSRFLAAYAWNNIQATYSLMRRYQDSLEASREAALLDEGVVRGTLAWLTSAIQAGAASDIGAAAVELAAAGNDASGEVAERDAYLKRTRAQGVWTPTAESQTILSNWRSAWHPAEQLLEAFR